MGFKSNGNILRYWFGIVLCLSAILSAYGTVEARNKLDLSQGQEDGESIHINGRRSVRGNKVCAVKQDELLPLAFEPFPLGTIKPRGWLRDQLKLMSDGLAGHEIDFYRIVRDSPWLGGDQEYSALHESLPYWFNGVVPLAYSMDDKRLIGHVRDIVDYIIEHQQEDGWLGAETNVSQRNFWARYPLFLGLTQMIEAEEGRGDEEYANRILDSMYKFINLMHSMLSDDLQGLVSKPGDDFDEQWGRSRAADMIVSLQWLYEKHPRGRESKLLECMDFFNQGAHDWAYWFSEDVYIKRDLDTVPANITEKLYHYEHGVNAGQGLKAGAVIRRFTHNDSLLESIHNGFEWTYTYHGTPSGGIIADERLSGRSPVRGVELCSVVETMYSLTYLFQSLGEKEFAEMCEFAAFNALPVMVTPDWWAHQYVTQTNQPVSHEIDDTPFYNVGSKGQRYGLEPNYPCCTVNHPQGYPKFVSNMFTWSRTDKAVVHSLLGPGELEATLETGADVKISCDTTYPFTGKLVYTIKTTEPLNFLVRVPDWVDQGDSVISIDSKDTTPVKPDSKTGLHKLAIPKGEHKVVYNLKNRVWVYPRANATVSIYNGGVLYAIPLDPDVKSKQSDYPNAPEKALEYTMAPKKKWGLAVDLDTLSFNPRPDESTSLPDPLWAEASTDKKGDSFLGSFTVKACEIKWELTGEKGWAPNPPLKDKRKCIGEPFEIELVPYGTAKLHMAELPTVDLKSS